MTHRHPRPRRSDPPSFLPSLPRARTHVRLDRIRGGGGSAAQWRGTQTARRAALLWSGERGMEKVGALARGFLHAAEGEVIWARVRNRGGEDSEERIKGWIRVADISLTNIIPSSTEW